MELLQHERKMELELKEPFVDKPGECISNFRLLSQAVSIVFTVSFSSSRSVRRQTITGKLLQFQ